MDLLDRLDRLPLSRPHYRLLLMGGLGYMFESVDVVTVTFSVPALREKWGLSLPQAGLITGSTPVGFLIGALIAGVVADRIGRRAVMMYALVLYCLFTAMAALSPTFELFLGARAVAGIGLGAELAIVAPFLSEFVPARRRGWFIGVLGAFLAVGSFLAALLGRFLVEPVDDGWRYAQLLTALPVMMIVWWRRALPESPRFLLLQGRVREATAVVEDFERRSGGPVAAAAPVAAEPDVAVETPAHTHPPVTLVTGLRFLWAPAMRRRTAVVWTIWFAFVFTTAAFNTWIPTLLVERGLQTQQSFTYSIAIYFAQIPGYLFGAYLCDRIDRKQTIAGTLAAGAVSALVFGLAATDLVLVLAGMGFAFFMQAATAAIYAYTPEVFPTWIRATGAGLASAVSRVGSISAPLLVGVAIGSVGFVGIFGTLTVILAVAVAVVLVFGLSTSGRSLEETSETADVHDQARALARDDGAQDAQDAPPARPVLPTDGRQDA